MVGYDGERGTCLLEGTPEEDDEYGDDIYDSNVHLVCLRQTVVGDDEYDFTSPVTNSMTLTAHWEAIPEPEPTEPEQPEPSNPEPTEPENQEQNNETTPSEQESTEIKANKNNGAVVAAVAGTSGVTGVAALGIIVGVVLKKRRK